MGYYNDLILWLTPVILDILFTMMIINHCKILLAIVWLFPATVIHWTSECMFLGWDVWLLEKGFRHIGGRKLIETNTFTGFQQDIFLELAPSIFASIWEHEYLIHRLSVMLFLFFHLSTSIGCWVWSCLIDIERTPGPAMLFGFTSWNYSDLLRWGSCQGQHLDWIWAYNHKGAWSSIHW